MFITFDYKCLNEECSMHNKRLERFHKKDEVQLCKECKTAMLKMPCAPKQPHISWSTWRMM